VPTVQLIEELAGGNAFWSPQQLSSMSAETFRATAETLGSITDYNTQQLDALQGKAVEVRRKTLALDQLIYLIT